MGRIRQIQTGRWLLPDNSEITDAFARRKLSGRYKGQDISPLQPKVEYLMMGSTIENLCEEAAEFWPLHVRANYNLFENCSTERRGFFRTATACCLEDEHGGSVDV
jgi:hypothetical protein